MDVLLISSLFRAADGEIKEMAYSVIKNKHLSERWKLSVYVFVSETRVCDTWSGGPQCWSSLPKVQPGRLCPGVWKLFSLTSKCHKRPSPGLLCVFLGWCGMMIWSVQPSVSVVVPLTPPLPTYTGRNAFTKSQIVSSCGIARNFLLFLELGLPSSCRSY